MAVSLFHSAIQTNVAHKLIEYEQYRTFTELTVNIHGTDYKPDVCLYLFKKFDWKLDTIRVTEMPLLVVEVISPTQGVQEVMEKVKMFLEAGVKSCWVVTIFPKNVSVFSSFESDVNFISGEIVDDSLGIKIPFESVFI